MGRGNPCSDVCHPSFREGKRSLRSGYLAFQRHSEDRRWPQDKHVLKRKGRPYYNGRFLLWLSGNLCIWRQCWTSSVLLENLKFKRWLQSIVIISFRFQNLLCIWDRTGCALVIKVDLILRILKTVNQEIGFGTYKTPRLTTVTTRGLSESHRRLVVQWWLLHLPIAKVIQRSFPLPSKKLKDEGSK